MKLEELQEEISGIKKALHLSYLLVDINNYTKEELRKERSSIAKAMLMEKIRDREELLEELEKVVKEQLTLEEQNFVLAIIDNIATEEIGEEKAKELREKIKGKVVDTMVMENLRDIFRMNYKEGVEFGIKERDSKAE